MLNTGEQKAAHPKGYRLYPQKYWGYSQLGAQTTLKCYVGRTIPLSPYTSSIGITFEILCNSNQENTTRTSAYSRAYDIEQCIVEALHGVNMTGIGVIDFSRQAHIDNGSTPIADEAVGVLGREWGTRTPGVLKKVEGDGTMAKYTISNNYQRGGRLPSLTGKLHKGGGLVCR